MTPKSTKVALLTLLFIAIPAVAQQPKPSQTPARDDDVIRITTNVVQVDVTVTDKDGKLVTNLDAADFEIIEEGKTVKTEYFLFVPLIVQTVVEGQNSSAVETEAPVTVDQLKRIFVFLVDNPLIDIGTSQSGATGVSSGTVSFRARATRAGAEAEKLLTWFVDTQMGSHDLVAIADTEMNIGKLSSFTNDRELLRSAIQHIRANSNSAQKPVIRIMSVNGEFGTQQLVQQNLRVIKTLSTVIDRLKTLPGRKVVSLLSRGMMFDSRLPGSDVVKERMEELIATANRERITIYTMSPTGLGNFGGVSINATRNMMPGRMSVAGTAQGLQDIDSLSYLAKETGGRAIYGTNDTRVGFAQVLEENRGYYLLGYNPGAEAPGRPHRLKVVVKRPGLRVQARATAYSNPK